MKRLFKQKYIETLEALEKYETSLPKKAELETWVLVQSHLVRALITCFDDLADSDDKLSDRCKALENELKKLKTR